MKIFVTGGTGFIGSHFVVQALAAGHELVVLRRSGSEPRIPLSEKPHWLEVPFDELQIEHFEGIERVVHLAAHSANVPYDTLENCLHWNVTVPLRMAARAHEAGVTRFTVAGSCFEYGLAGERYDFIPPDAPLEPTQSYAISKAAASIAWAGFSRVTGASVSILRIFQVYGEGEPAGRLWPSLRAAAQNGNDYKMTLGEQVRDFIPVEQVARELLWEVERPNSGLTIRNVGTGNPESVAEFAARTWSHYRASSKLLLGALQYRPNEVMRYVPRVP